jgi:hypothetical protein
VNDKAVVLAEAAGVEEQLDPFARGELAGLVLALDARRTAALERAVVELVELLDLLLDRQASTPSAPAAQ